MGDIESIERPELTLPPEEAAVLRAAYEAANTILEYGSGGSTVMATEMPGKRIFTVESDQRWAAMMQGYIDAHPPAKDTRIDLIWADIGATKKWGYPQDLSAYLQFPEYPLAVWSRADFVQPDVVLVDGRFRVGCAIAAALSTERPVRVLFDDYGPRRRYHMVETYLGKPKLHGRMAEFRVEPLAVTPDNLLAVIQMIMRTA